MNSCLLIRLLQEPQRARQMDARDWDLLLRQARQANVVCAIDSLFNDQHLGHLIPDYVQRHFRWASTLAARHTQAVRYEIDCIYSALSQLDIDIVLLKGAAYVQADLPLAKGRLFSDVDIMVDKARLHEVEAALMLHGWVSRGHTSYDQYYYRTWMHELPPMQHTRRLTTIDVHHAILPQTSAARPESSKLMADAVTVDSTRRLRVLAPVDMVIHSATHLFYDGEFDNGLRDLIDLHRLLMQFAPEDRFFERLCQRAADLRLTRPLFYAVRYLQHILGMQVPQNIVEIVRAFEDPSRLQLQLMDQAFLRAFCPKHSSCDDRFSSVAHSFIYIRANWLRMPPLLLAAHLSYKAFVTPIVQQRQRREEARLRSIAEIRR